MLLFRSTSVAMLVSLIAAVTTPNVLMSMMLAWPTVAEPFVTVAATPAAVSMPLALIAVAISLAAPVRVPTEPAFTLTIVLVSSVFRSAALTEPSLTVILKAFPVLLLRPASVVMSLLLIVAVTTPVVLLSIVLAWATVAVPLVTFAATFPAVSMVEALMAVAISAALPVSVATEPALTLTVVLVSRVLRAAASTEVSVTEIV